MPRKNENDYGELDSISYNSLLGSSETVNIPVLWVDDEVYVLIDGIFKAMGELLIKPRVMGNMEKIPFYICIKYGLDEKVELIDTDEVYVEVDGEKKYFNHVLKTPECIFLPLDRFVEVYGGEKIETDKDIYVNNLKIDNGIKKIIYRYKNNLNKIIGKNVNCELYTIKYNKTITENKLLDKVCDIKKYKNQFFINLKPYNNNDLNTVLVKPVMLKYISEKNGYKVKENINKNYIQLLYNNGIKKEIYQYYKFYGRSVVSSNFFAINFKNFNNRFHELNDFYESKEDAITALAFMQYGRDLKGEEFEIEEINNTYRIVGAKPIGEYNKLYQKGEINANKFYYKVYNFYVFEGNEGEFKKIIRYTGDIMNIINKAYGKEPTYISLSQLKQIYYIKDNLNKIYWGKTFNIKNYNLDSYIAEFEFTDITQNFVDELNKQLNEFEINNYERICHFIAQCTIESQAGQFMLEGGTWVPNPINTYASRDKNPLNLEGGIGYGAKYRGSGLIQITYKDCYKKLYDYLKSKGIDDYKIVSEGAVYVAMNYPIVAACYFWSIYKNYLNLNEKCDNGISVEYITGIVNGNSTDKIYERTSAYNVCKQVLINLNN